MATEERTWTIGEIKSANARAGKYFFSSATMRFFDSRVSGRVYQGPGGVYFVTSEQFHDGRGYSGPRQYTVRVFDPSTGSVETAGRYTGNDGVTYTTEDGQQSNQLDRDEAVRQAKRLAGGYTR